jgi:hypothetical protein
VFVGLLKFINHRNSIAGWWLTYPAEKYEFVSWDDDIPNKWKHVPNHQPVGSERIDDDFIDMLN